MMTLILLLFLALLFDALLGDPHGWCHPLVLFGKAASGVESFCRAWFGSGVLAGGVGWLILTVVPAALAWGVVWGVPGWSKLLVAAGLLYVTIALRSLIGHAEAIRRPLADGDLGAARHALSMIVSRDTETLDESEIVRGGVESLGENLIDAVTSPFFFATLGYIIGGLPAAAAAAVFLRAVNTLDACWGYRSERYLRFGRIAARADDVAHFLPARLTLPAIAIAATLCGLSGRSALRTGVRHRNDHASPNSCWGMAGFAGALGVRLGGPTVYAGNVEAYPYWGGGRTVLNTGDLFQAERLTIAAALVFVLLVMGMGELWLWLSEFY